MKAVVFKDPEILSLSKSYVCVLLLASKNRSMMGRLELTGAPSYAVLKTNGEPIKAFTGTSDELGISTMLKEPLTSLVEAHEQRLEAAHRLAAAGEHVRAYLAYQRLATQLSWSAPAKAAAQGVNKMRADKVVWDKIQRSLREQRARELVAKAERLLVRQELSQALALLELTAKTYPNTPSGKSAAERAGKMRNNPEVMKTLRRLAQEKQARTWWNLASSFLRNKRPDLARGYLRKIVEKCPDTAYAAKAKETLEQLD